MTQKNLNIAICGSTGRMGKAVIEVINNQYINDIHVNIAGLINSATTADELQNIMKISDVVIDFSLPMATDKILEAAIDAQTPIVICTTGLDDRQHKKIEMAANSIPVLYASNTSIGANLLMDISGKIAAILKDYDAEIIDIHHKNKKDAPSGTAISIAKSIAENRGGEGCDNIINIGRSGINKRAENEIGISSVRSGGIYGRHDVLFANENEVITVSHQALSRNVFAEGAIKAGIWLVSKPKGLYHMKDVITRIKDKKI